MARPASDCNAAQQLCPLTAYSPFFESNTEQSERYWYDLVIGPLQMAAGFELFHNVFARANQQLQNDKLKRLVELEHFLVHEAKVITRFRLERKFVNSF
jgi:hypothetical protein